MRLAKSLLTVISALALATGATFAGDGSQWQSVINDSSLMSESDRLALSEPEVIYYEETIVFTPSVDKETPLG